MNMMRSVVRTWRTAHSLPRGAAFVSFGFVLALLAPSALRAQSTATNLDLRPLLTMSLEQLTTLKVTSVSKKEERLSEASAAISVITQDDINRSGVTSIPDALRLAPGVDVGRVDAHEWAVGVRGMNDTFASGLLTLIDGRSIYTPLFSGTFWQSQDVLLQDIDRIEVIRGPGAAIWGANAFNGVINVVTKPASETQGLLLSGGGGSDLLTSDAIRYGGKLGDHAAYRVYGKYDQWDDSRLLGGGAADDAWSKSQGGFRVDWQPSDANLLTLQGDFYGLQADQSLPQLSLGPPYEAANLGQWKQDGGNALARWTRSLADDSDLTLQAYYDGADMNLPILRDRQSTFDLDVRHRFHWGERQEIVWGGGYRLVRSGFESSFEVTLRDETRLDQIGNGFVQDEVTLVPDRLKATLGVKVEDNNITGVEVQPGGRIAWTPTDKQTIWASVSRAVRTPSAFENDGSINLAVIPPSPASGPFPVLVTFQGNSGFRSEELIAYELGYRLQPHPRVSLDATGFINSYNGLRSTTDRIDLSHLFSYVQVVSSAANEVTGTTYGAELSLAWQTTDWWRLSGAYSFLNGELDAPASVAVSGGGPSLEAAKHQFSIRSSMDLTREIELDLWVRYVAGISSAGVYIPGSPIPPAIPSYATLDARIAWRPIKQLELSIVGQNLFDSPHREFNPSYYSTQATEVSRSVFGKATWRF